MKTKLFFLLCFLGFSFCLKAQYKFCITKTDGTSVEFFDNEIWEISFTNVNNLPNVGMCLDLSSGTHEYIIENNINLRFENKSSISLYAPHINALYGFQIINGFRLMNNMTDIQKVRQDGVIVDEDNDLFMTGESPTRIYNLDGNIIKTFSTEEKGVISIEEIPQGLNVVNSGNKSKTILKK